MDEHVLSISARGFRDGVLVRRLLPHYMTYSLSLSSA